MARNRIWRGGPPPHRRRSVVRARIFSNVPRNALSRRPIPDNGYSFIIYGPANGSGTTDRRPDISLYVESVLDTPVDVQVEWRTEEPYFQNNQWKPEPTHVREVLGVPSGTPLLVEPLQDLPYLTWFFRVRVGSKSANLWTAWSDSRNRVHVNSVLGTAFAYIDANVGVGQAQAASAVQYVHMNVGIENLSGLDAFRYAEMNIGIPTVPLNASRYTDFNIHPRVGNYIATKYSDLLVTTGKPIPHIWWVRPVQGREGYAFHIFGHGFGSIQGQYSGKVRLGALDCEILRWEAFPAQPVPVGGHVIKQGVALEDDRITTEYGRIVAVVPDNAVSAGVTVSLEGG